MKARYRAVRRATAVLALVVAAGAPGCGDQGSTREGLDDALGYIPANSGGVLVVSTDLDNERYDELNGDFGKRLLGDGKGLRDTIEDFVDEAGFDWDDDVESLLGEYLVVGTDSFESLLLPEGTESSSLIAALRVDDPGELEDLLDDVPEVERVDPAAGAAPGEPVPDADRVYSIGEDDGALAIDGEVLVLAEDMGTLERALNTRNGPDRLTVEKFEAAAGKLGPEDALVRGYAELKSSVLSDPRFQRFRKDKWVDAVRTGGLNADLDGDTLVVAAAVNTDPFGLTDADLPLVTGGRTPPLVERPGHLSGGSINQSQTTAWLLRLVRGAYPRSDFVRHVADAERELKIDFEREFLRQFDGPSASIVTPDGRFAARSTVGDPGALRSIVDRLAPRLPQLILDLQALDTEGLTALFLVAPDAPVATRRFEKGGISVTELPSGLYEVRGLRAPAPRVLVFGLVGEVFVVASDEAAARDIAEAQAKEPSGIDGVSVAKGDARALGRLLQALSIDGATDAAGSLAVTRSRLTAKARIELDELGAGRP
jgi:hypothetical protein